MRDYLGARRVRARRGQAAVRRPAWRHGDDRSGAEGTYVAVRPSGTEPKVKYYMFTYEPAESWPIWRTPRPSTPRGWRTLGQRPDRVFAIGAVSVELLALLVGAIGLTPQASARLQLGRYAPCSVAYSPRLQVGAVDPGRCNRHEPMSSTSCPTRFEARRRDPRREGLPAESTRRSALAFAGPLAKVREFPQTPGVYLMKDSAGRVIYVGKAKNLRVAGRQLLSQGGGRGPPHGRPGARDRRHRFHRRPKAKSTRCWPRPG